MPSTDEVSAFIQQPLNLRCLALTGTFETSCPPPGCFGSVAGDFDGQGISFSALQWNLGQGTLQPILAEMNTLHPDLMKKVFGDCHGPLCGVLTQPRPQQLLWARSIQTPRHALTDQWNRPFQALGHTPEFQTVAARRASSLFDAAVSLCRTLGLKSQRAAALLFDIKVQNGGIGPAALTLIERDFASLGPASEDALETARLRSIANRVADSANPKWREDVRSRKLVVASGTGVVHGVHYDLGTQFGLTLAPWSGA